MDNLQKWREQIIKLNNSDEFKQLSRHYNKKSFFNILGISRKENIHSNFLHWLLSPDESHELGDFALRRLLELAVLVKNKLQADNSELQFPDEIEDIVICGGYSLDRIKCDREHVTTSGDRLDLFLSFVFRTEQTDKLLNIVIENKVKSKEGKEQTAVYYEYGQSEEGESIYLFLSPLSNSDFEAQCHPDCKCKKFIGLNYQYLVDYVLEPCLTECGAADGKVFIEEYLRALSQPSLQFEEYDGGEIIMAISAKERELLRKFWEKNKDLLVAALSAHADNMEPEEGESVRAGLQAIRKAGSKDYSTYSFNGENYNKRRLVLAVVKKYVEDKLGITADDLKKAFDNEQLKIFVSAAEAKEIEERTGYSRHFIDETINFADGDELAVSNQWGSAGIGKFIETAEKLGYKIKPLNQTEEVRIYIQAKMQEAQSQGQKHLVILAGDVIRDKLDGNYQKSSIVCRAMNSIKLDGDEVLYSSDSGMSSGLKIQYDLTTREFE